MVFREVCFPGYAALSSRLPRAMTVSSRGSTTPGGKTPLPPLRRAAHCSALRNPEAPLSCKLSGAQPTASGRRQLEQAVADNWNGEASPATNPDEEDAHVPTRPARRRVSSRRTGVRHRSARRRTVAVSSTTGAGASSTAGAATGLSSTGAGTSAAGVSVAARPTDQPTTKAPTISTSRGRTRGDVVLATSMSLSSNIRPAPCVPRTGDESQKALRGCRLPSI